MKLHHCSSIIIGLLCFTFHCIRSDIIPQRKIVIDTDAGADDATALLLALKHESLFPSNFKILAITCVYGNTDVHNVGENVLKILTIANRSDIPVYIGSHKPLINNYISTNYFGNDGFGDFDFEENIIAQVDQSKHAALALKDLVQQYPDELTIICLGPATNVALAISLDPTFAKNVKEMFVMGSSVAGVGNVAPNVEFNFSLDPESNFILLNSTTKNPMVLLPWETAFKHAITMEWRMDVLGKRNTTVMDFLNKAEKVALKQQEAWISADSYMIALAMDPQLLTKSILTHVTAVIDGSARGSVLVDYTNITSRVENVQILQEFKIDELKKIFIDYLG